MRVTATGRQIEVTRGATLSDVVRELGFGERWVVVERNGEAVARSELGAVAVEEGDVLEIVRPVQGG